MNGDESGREGRPADREALAYCSDVVDRLKDIVGDNLVGVYVHGSVALGDFMPSHSDIDILAVSNDVIAAGVKASLRDVLSPSALSCPASGLEFSLITRDSLRRVESAPPFEVHMTTETKDGSERFVDGVGGAGDADLVMHYAVLERRGVTLFGPPASEVFPRVPRDLMLRALRDELDWAAENASTSYQVLNAARAWLFAAEGGIRSKSEGGEWARTRTDDPSLVDAALAHRRGRSTAHPREDRAVRFVDRVKRRLDAALEAGKDLDLR